MRFVSDVFCRKKEMLDNLCSAVSALSSHCSISGRPLFIAIAILFITSFRCRRYRRVYRRRSRCLSSASPRFTRLISADTLMFPDALATVLFVSHQAHKPWRPPVAGRSGAEGELGERGTNRKRGTSECGSGRCAEESVSFKASSIVKPSGGCGAYREGITGCLRC